MTSNQSTRARVGGGVSMQRMSYREESHWMTLYNTFTTQASVTTKNCCAIISFLDRTVIMFAPPVYYHRVSPTATMPIKGSFGAAGWDLFPTKPGFIPAKTRLLIPIGIQLVIPYGSYGRIASRSGLASRGIDVCAGVIDSDYRGEVQVLLANHSQVAFNYGTEKAIAQLIIETLGPSLQEIRESSEFLNLSHFTTDRGDKGFGSTDNRPHFHQMSTRTVSNVLSHATAMPNSSEQELYDKFIDPKQRELQERAAEKRVEAYGVEHSCHCGSVDCPGRTIVHDLGQTLLKPGQEQYLDQPALQSEF